MDDNIKRVLQLLQDGKITAQEAESLISALSGGPASPPRSAPETTQPSAPPPPIETPLPPQRPVEPAPPPPPFSTAENKTGSLPTGELLLQIAEDPSIAENEKLTLIIHATALICTIIALQPIPGVDVFILMPIQVASVMAMSHVMGEPLGKNGAGEIVTSIVAVVGWGVVAQQFVLAGAKLLFPLFGGLTLIPLIYASVYGLGYAARAVLEARRSNRQLSDAEIRHIKEDAERRARAEQRDWSLVALKRELDEWRAKAEAYKQHEAGYTEDQARYEQLSQELEPLNSRMSNLTQQKTDMEQRLQTATERLQGDLPDIERAERQVKIDRLRADLDAVNAAWQSEGAQLEQRRNEVVAITERLEQRVGDRYRACYPNVSVTSEALSSLSVLPYSRLYQAERQISLLQHEPAKADYQDAVIADREGLGVFSIAFDDDGRLYTSTRGEKVIIRAVGSRRTEDKDIQRLRDSTLSYESI
jgi:uncharacterized protein (DUF697 family)